MTPFFSCCKRSPEAQPLHSIIVKNTGTKDTSPPDVKEQLFCTPHPIPLTLALNILTDIMNTINAARGSDCYTV